MRATVEMSRVVSCGAANFARENCLTCGLYRLYSLKVCIIPTMSKSLYITEPPQGQSRHSADPDRSSQVGITGIVTTVVAAVALAARIFTRFHVLKNAGTDDCKSCQTDSKTEGSSAVNVP